MTLEGTLKTRFMKMGELRKMDNPEELTQRKIKLIEELETRTKRNQDLRRDLRLGKQGFEYYLLMALRAKDDGKTVTDSLQRKLQEGTDNANRIVNINKELCEIKKHLPKKPKPFSSYFMEACNAEMDDEEFNFFKQEAEKLMLIDAKNKTEGIEQ